MQYLWSFREHGSSNLYLFDLKMPGKASEILKKLLQNHLFGQANMDNLAVYSKTFLDGNLELRKTSRVIEKENMWLKVNSGEFIIESLEVPGHMSGA